MLQYLSESKVINFRHSDVSAKAKELSHHHNTPTDIAKACFEWVRDHIQHSGDIGTAGDACTASEVIQAGDAWCFGKSHLLVALLRANDIPSAFCYQRLRKDDIGGFTLHGLVSIFLPYHGWYRVAPRGNKEGVNAQFTPPNEQLAWSTDSIDEIDFTEKFIEPQNIACEWMKQNTSNQQAFATLPDLIKLPDLILKNPSLPPTHLTYQDITIVFSKMTAGDVSKGFVPSYHFRILNKYGNDIGHINYRVGNTEHVLKAAGHIGYKIKEQYRGSRSAAKACLALSSWLKPLSSQAIDPILINVDPDNVASNKTLEIIGAKFIDEILVPHGDPHYLRGSYKKRRYHWHLTI